MRKKRKNPKARAAAAKKLLAMSLRKRMTKGALEGNAMSDKDKMPQNGMQMDAGNPGMDMK